MHETVPLIIAGIIAKMYFRYGLGAFIMDNFAEGRSAKPGAGIEQWLRTRPLMFILAAVFLLLSGFSPFSVTAQTSMIVTEEYLVPSGDHGIHLYVRNKRPISMTSYSPERVVLFVHGATYPSETSFDLQVGGFSWMDFIAKHGYDVYMMDVRGYGRSTRPPEMSVPAAESGPIVHTDVAVRDLATVVDHIRARRGVHTINLIGWSWGTSIVGSYAAMNSDRVTRLVLYAPQWIRQFPAASTPALPAYRIVTKETATQRWLRGVPAAAQADLIPQGWLDTWWKANMLSDTAGAKQDPPVVRAPNGCVHDGHRYWGSNTPLYDPSTIEVPVLVVHGDWDVDTPAYMAQAVFARLTKSPLKRYIVIGEGTHTVLLERNRMQLFREVQLFLDSS